MPGETPKEAAPTTTPSCSGGAQASPAPSQAAALELRHASGPEDMRVFAGLTREYFDWLKEDLDFQDVETELAGLPGRYASPRGAVIFAVAPAAADGGSGVDDSASAIVGCVALRPLDKPQEQQQQQQYPAPPAPAAEVKRLWVRPAHKKRGAGAALVGAVIAAARAAGYKSIVLDTLERLEAANRLYAGFGFRRRAPYYDNPLNGVVYWQLDL
jgi:ribosomal protein S18 acetylase RimI-like enzyme